MFISGVVKFQAFPDLDGNVIVARILLPQGTPLSRTEQVVSDITSGIARVNKDFKNRQPDNQDLVQATFVQIQSK